MKLIFKKNEKAITNPHRHTLTVSYGSSVTPLTEDYAAPFRNLQEGAYILNLHVDGHIYTSKTNAQANCCFLKVLMLRPPLSLKLTT